MTKSEIESLAKKQYRQEITKEIDDLFKYKQPIPHLLFLYKNLFGQAEDFKMIGDSSHKFRLLALVINSMITKEGTREFKEEEAEVLFESIIHEIKTFGGTRSNELKIQKKKE